MNAFALSRILLPRLRRSAQILGHNLLAPGEFRFDFGCACKMKKIVVHNGVVTLVGSRKL